MTSAYTNYRYVLAYDTFFKTDVIEDALKQAWKTVPSKNNFMPYKVHVIGPDAVNVRELVYYKCLQKQFRTRGENPNTIEEIKKLEKRHTKKYKTTAQFKNIRTAPYIIIFTQRVEDRPNAYQQENISKGYTYEQMMTEGPGKEFAQSLAYLEIGMFSANFASVCLQNNIDISYTMCMPYDLSNWQEPEFSFLDSNPLLIMTAGLGEHYRRDRLPMDEDKKPEFERIVNIV